MNCVEEKVDIGNGKSAIIRSYGIENDLVVSFKDRVISEGQSLDLLEILRNCGSCPLLNSDRLSDSEYSICKSCVLSQIGLLLPVNGDMANQLSYEDNAAYNSNLGYLLSLLRTQPATQPSSPSTEPIDIPMVSPGEKLSPELRKMVYQRYLVDAEVKASKTWLAKRTGVSSRQVNRDLEDMGLSEYL